MAGEVEPYTDGELIVISYNMCILREQDWDNALSEFNQIPWDILLCQELGQMRHCQMFRDKLPEGLQMYAFADGCIYAS